MAHDRFVNNALSELQEANRSPIYGYQHLPILSLEEAIEKIIPLVPGIVEYVSAAKKNCNRNSNLLTCSESAAVYLYTMPTPLFSCLNSTLRTEHRHLLKPWFAFLKLFITALKKLPSTKATVWRGVNYDDTLTFVDNDLHIWWSINSCSKDPSIIQPFLGERGTLFAIDAIQCKDISAFSAISDENEVILMPGTRVRRKYETLSLIDRFFVIHLVEENRERYVCLKCSLNQLNELSMINYTKLIRIKIERADISVEMCCKVIF
jgi:hypothetical protein